MPKAQEERLPARLLDVDEVARAPEETAIAIEKKPTAYIRADKTTPKPIEENDIAFQLPRTKRFG